MIKVDHKIDNSSKDLTHHILQLLESNTKLINRIDKLVSLFDEAAKHVGEVETTETKVNNLVTKLDTLLEQNKALAQGLLLLEKYVRGKTKLEVSSQPSSMSQFQ